MKSKIFIVAALISSLAACTTKNNSMSDQGANPNTESADTGKGAPALGGPGNRSNASMPDARGSAHTSNVISSSPSPNSGGK